MRNKAMFVVAFGLVAFPMAALAKTPADKVVVQTPTNQETLIVKSGMTAPVSFMVRQGNLWKGYRGSIQDMGRAISYRFTIHDAISAKGTELVQGLIPLHDGVTTIVLRPGMVPAVNG